jgi:hypothetical protein
VFGLQGTERHAQRAFERQVLARIVAECGPDGVAPAERVEQALGYYRDAAAGNPAQQVLARRLRAVVAALHAQNLLEAAAPPDTYRPTAEGLAVVARDQQPWWRRALASARRA